MHNGAGPWDCFWCGKSVDHHEVVVHHDDGDHQNNAADNLQPAHRGCHTLHHLAEPERRARLRTCRLELRLSVQEREAIEAKAKSCGMSLSDYIRYAALAEEEPVHPGAVATAAAIRASLGFRCPIQGCGFACASSAARCPAHGRQVVYA